MNKTTRSPLLDRYETWGYPQKHLKLPIVIRVADEAILKTFDSRVTFHKIPFLDNGYSVSAPFSLASSPQYLKGQIYIQEAASQYAAQVLNPTKDDIVLDLCAAPGSKTTHLSELMQNEGVLIANDKKPKRLEKLQYNLERCSVKNVVVTNQDAKVAHFPYLFDKILLDAPCSGNFILERNWLQKRKVEDFAKMANLQKEILTHALSLLKPGGILLYTTCSLEIEENEHVIESVLNDSYVLEPIEQGEPGLTENTKQCKRFWPSHMKTQGFFLALIRKL